MHRRIHRAIILRLAVRHYPAGFAALFFVGFVTGGLVTLGLLKLLT